MAYKIVKSASGVQESSDKCEVLIESEADIKSLPEYLACGSVAYTASMEAMFMKAINGKWTRIGG